MIKIKPILAKAPSKEDWRKELERQINEAVKHVRCPEHNARPRVRLAADGSLSLEGPCCERLAALADEALKEFAP